MKTATEHMELPYCAGNGLRIEYGPIVAGDGFLVATVSRDSHNPEERRDFIIRACNCHADLLEACKAVVARCHCEEASCPTCQTLALAIDKALKGT